MSDTKRVRIYVTPKDIAEGYAGNCSKCPVARAVARKVKSNATVEVGAFSVGFHYGNFSADLPAIAREFIHNFDTGGAIPARLNFRLDLPVEVCK